jgi:hypothetical protein
MCECSSPPFEPPQNVTMDPWQNPSAAELSAGDHRIYATGPVRGRVRVVHVAGSD